MSRLLSVWLVLILATLVHVDWHFARPAHHRLSLDWSSHWLFALAFFTAAGVYIARRWPSARWRAALLNVSLALLVAQIVVPVATTAYYDHRLAYEVEPEFWPVFWVCIGAGLPAMTAALLMTPAPAKPLTG